MSTFGIGRERLEREGSCCGTGPSSTANPSTWCWGASGADVKVLVYRSPNTNAYVERFVQAVQQEFLDKFIVFGREHMDHVLAEYLARIIHVPL